MLVILVVLVVATYIVLDQSGLLADLAAAVRERTGAPPPPQVLESREAEPSSQEQSRLEVFEEFIEKLDSSSEDDE